MTDSDYLAEIEPHGLAERVRSEILTRADRRNRILGLRRRGLTCEQIAYTLAHSETDPIYMDPSGIALAIRTHLERLHREDVESVDQLRVLENERLDSLYAIYHAKAINGDVKAAQICVRISHRRSKMNGLEAPIKHDHTVRGSVLHELGVDPDEVERGREAFATAFEGAGLDDVQVVEHEGEPHELGPGNS